MASSLFFLVVPHFDQPLSVLISTWSWLNWVSLNNYNHLPVSIWYLDAELGTSLLARCWLVILCTSCQRSTDGMGGNRMGSLGGTTDPLPLPISCTNNMPHASRVRPILSSDRSSPALQPLRTTAWACLPPVLNSLSYWVAEAWTNSLLATGRLPVH